MKAIRRKTTGTGRMRHLKTVQRRFSNGFREGERPFGVGQVGQPGAVQWRAQCRLGGPLPALHLVAEGKAWSAVQRGSVAGLQLRSGSS